MIQRLEKECAELEQQLRTINSILTGVNAPLPGKAEAGQPIEQPVNDQDSKRATA